MEESEFYKLEGEEINPNELSIQNCISVKRLIADDDFPYFDLIQCKRDDEGNEYLIFDVEPSIPQKPEIDIKKSERIGVKFLANEDGKPETYVLRKNFPPAPHINYSPEGTPKNLCLSIHPFEEEKVNWTAAKHLNRIHRWLSDTSKDQLHLADQPLENVFYGTNNRIILPSYFFDIEKSVEDLTVEFVPLEAIKDNFVIIGLDQELAKKYLIESQVKFKTITIDIENPIVHGLIDLQPNTLFGLFQYLKKLNVDLFLHLRSKFFQKKPEDLKGYGLLLLIRIPKKRAARENIEEFEIITFLSFIDLLEISQGLGIYYDGPRHVMGPIDYRVRDNSKLIELSLLNPTAILTSEDAALYNNLDFASDKQVAAIGLGALGSQLILNTLKAGQGRWKLVDKDHFLPHNAARHGLPTVYMGMPKTTALNSFIERIFVEESITSYQNLDILNEDVNTIIAFLKDLDFIFDFSASVSVSRRLSLDLEIEKPVISFFLNPSGNDLVLIAESKDRSYSLDILEMEYYKSLYSTTNMEEHLKIKDEKIRYAQRCNDISSRIPQYLVAIHAGIGSKEIVDIISKHDEPKIKIWQVTDNLEVKKNEIKASKYLDKNNEQWRIKVSIELLKKIDAERKNKLPNETGGVLIGSIDHFRKIIYAVDSISSPSDSDEWPRAYIRGVKGLKEQLKSIGEKTAGNLQYLGEWHSHPDKAELNPSADDKKLFRWLESHLKLESLPPIMAIVGNGKSCWYISQVDEPINFDI